MINSTWQQIKGADSYKKNELLSKLLMREQVIDGIRRFFKDKAFHEIETPLFVKSPGTEPYLEVFESELTTSAGQKCAGYFTTSPEYAMKKIVVAGLPKIFQICKSFRNGEGIGPTHNHEFTILEWYRSPADYFDVMRDCEELLRYLADRCLGVNDHLLYQGKKYQLDQEFYRFTISELFAKYLDFSEDELLNEALLIAKVKEFNFGTAENWDDAFVLLMSNVIEPAITDLDRPVFIYRYPIGQAALSKPTNDDPRFAERFEMFIAGLELGNAFSELTDAVVQKKRLIADLDLRQQLGKKKYDLDQDFIDALSAGMPPTGGIAVGVDRLVMLFADAASIEDVLWFSDREIFQLE